jgi:hypothetical protein
MNRWRSVRTVFGSNKVQAHPAHARPSYTRIVSSASLKKKIGFYVILLLRIIIVFIKKKLKNKSIRIHIRYFQYNILKKYIFEYKNSNIRILIIILE